MKFKDRQTLTQRSSEYFYPFLNTATWQISFSDIYQYLKAQEYFGAKIPVDIFKTCQ